MTDQGGERLKTLDELEAALREGRGGKCERCRKGMGALAMSLAIRRPVKVRGAGQPTVMPPIKANVCEACAVAIAEVVARAVGRVR